MNTNETSMTTGSKRSRRGRRLLIALGLVLGLILAGLALAPTIASSFVPGMIESSANSTIQGKVKVENVSIGWFSPIRVGPVFLSDAQGQGIAKVRVRTQVSLMEVLLERWWSARSLDIGQVEIDGHIALVEDEHGVSNLQQALTLRLPAAARQSGGVVRGTETGRAIKGCLKLDAMTMTRASADSSGKIGPAQGLNNIAGEVEFLLDTRSGLFATAKGEIKGTPISQSGASGKEMLLKIDSTAKQRSSSISTLESADVLVAADQVPIGLVDALLGFGGGLEAAVGPTADAKLLVKGNLKELVGDLTLTSSGVNVNLPVEIKGGILRAGKLVGTGGDSGIRVASIAGFELLPQLRPILTELSKQIQLEQAPTVELTVEAVKAPTPIDPTTGAAIKPEELDLRGSTAVLRLKIGAMRGRVFVPAEAEINASQKADQWKSFSTQPIEVVIDAADLDGTDSAAKPATITLTTQATLDQQPAGEIHAQITARGLLDQAGRLLALRVSGKDGPHNDARAANQKGRVDVALTCSGVSTALISPIITAAGLPIDPVRDIGPTLSMSAKATLAGAVLGSESLAIKDIAAMPPVTATMSIDAANLQLNGACELQQGMLTCSDQGVTVQIRSMGPMARRFLGELVESGGSGSNSTDPSMRASLTNLRVDLNQFLNPAAPISPGTVLRSTQALAAVNISDLNLSLPMGSDREPISVQVPSVDVRAELTQGRPPHLVLNADASVQGQTTNITADIAATGLHTTAFAWPKDDILAGISAIGVTGHFEVAKLPTALLDRLAAKEQSSASDAQPSSPHPAELVQKFAGKWLSLRMTTRPDDADAASQLLDVDVTSDTGRTGATIQTAATLGKRSDRHLAVNRCSFFAAPDQHMLDDLFASKPGSESAQAEEKTAATLPQTRLEFLSLPEANQRGQFEIAAEKPFSIPLKTDTRTPSLDLSGASPIDIRFGSNVPMLARNIVLGGDGSTESPWKILDVQLQTPYGKISAPAGALAGLMPDGQSDGPGSNHPIHATCSTQLTREGGSVLGNVSVQADVLSLGLPTQKINAQLTVSEINMPEFDSVLALDGLLEGMVGTSAKIVLATSIAPQTKDDHSMQLAADIESPGISGAKILIIKDPQRIALAEPAKITITPNPAAMNRLSGLTNHATPPKSPGAAPQDANDKSTKSTDGSFHPLEDLSRRMDEIFGSGQKSPSTQATSQTPSASTPNKDALTKVRIVDVGRIQLDLRKLAIAVSRFDADGKRLAGPLKPDIFQLDAAIHSEIITVESVRLAQDSGEAYDPLRMTLKGLDGSILSPEAGRVDARLNIAGVQTEDLSKNADAADARKNTADQGKPSSILLSIRKLANPKGVVTPKLALIDADADISQFPTAIIDALADQRGVLNELLGPTVSLNLKARDVSRRAATAASSATGSKGASKTGSLTATASSPRASAKINGIVRNAVFIQSEQPDSFEVRISTITPGLVPILAGSVPVVDSLEKRPEDEPAVITASGLEIPLNSDMSLLNGKMSISMGVTRFKTKTVFGKILKAVGGKEEGSLGRKIPPFTVTAAQGVLNYDRFTLPLGEFDLSTDGQVDLVQRQIRVTTYAPFFALAEEALGPLKLGFAGKLDVINRNTLVPITTRGSLDHPKTEIDAEAFLKSIGTNIIEQPGKILEDILGGKKKKPDQK